MKNHKEALLQHVKSHIGMVRLKIQEKLETAQTLANQSLKGFGKMPPEHQAVFMNQRANAYKRVSELEHLYGSPYFIKCGITDESGENKNYFFAKHEFSQESIYSWVAPISTIRFENPGKASYRLPSGEVKTITMHRKETYMIVDGSILLFAVEKEGEPRELIYQEHFTKQKSEFVLPEIVEQMEKAQDQVIRASHKGPLVISGPAGSGKTTLALHRVAYLTQVPDTALLYKPDSIIVFVQDNGTKEYFSTLLPSLGIHDVNITTFSEWAFKILGLEGYSYVERYGENEEGRDLYEYQKIKALREALIPAWNKNIFTILVSQYSGYLSKESSTLLDKQKKEKKLDRFDLAILLKSYFEKYKKFEIRRKYQTFVKSKLVQKTEKLPAAYSLMVIDEFQNYLPEQLRIFKHCLNEKTRSAVYVGDMAQQVKLGTIRQWEEISETIPAERIVKLSKVYRNTKNILTFIRDLGYDIEVPSELKEGPLVLEKTFSSAQEEIRHVREFAPKYSGGTIGILAQEESSLEIFKKEFSEEKNIHVLTMLETQGVEFDFVCIVGINERSFNVSHLTDTAPEHIEERKRMQKDLLYVALTRAITELHILGSAKLVRN